MLYRSLHILHQPDSLLHVRHVDDVHHHQRRQAGVPARGFLSNSGGALVINYQFRMSDKLRTSERELRFDFSLVRPSRKDGQHTVLVNRNGDNLG